MKTVIISQHADVLNHLLQQARQQQLILQAADGEQFLLARIADVQPGVVADHVEVQAFVVGTSDDFDEEIAQTRQNVALMDFLDERGAQAKAGSGIPIEEVRQRLGL